MSESWELKFLCHSWDILNVLCHMLNHAGCQVDLAFIGSGSSQSLKIMCTTTQAYAECVLFGALPAGTSPRGARHFSGCKDSHLLLYSLPVSVLFRVGSAKNNSQEGRDGNRTRLPGSRVQRLGPLGRHFYKLKVARDDLM